MEPRNEAHAPAGDDADRPSRSCRGGGGGAVQRLPRGGHRGTAGEHDRQGQAKRRGRHRRAAEELVQPSAVPVNITNKRSELLRSEHKILLW